MVGFIDDHRRVMGRVDLRGAADRPVDVLSAQGPGGGSDPALGTGAARRGAIIRRIWTEHFQVYGPRKV